MSWIDERSLHHRQTYSPATALNMFRNGMDTKDIATHMRLEEWQAVELLEAARKVQRREVTIEKAARMSV